MGPHEIRFNLDRVHCCLTKAEDQLLQPKKNMVVTNRVVTVSDTLMTCLFNFHDSLSLSLLRKNLRSSFLLFYFKHSGLDLCTTLLLLKLGLKNCLSQCWHSNPVQYFISQDAFYPNCEPMARWKMSRFAGGKNRMDFDLFLPHTHKHFNEINTRVTH